jgi:uncharacterized UBP type Zn finger protein
MFYGLGLKSNDLGVSPYLSFTISAIVEIVAYSVVHVILDIVGRKFPYFIFLFLTGVSCLSIAVIGKHKEKIEKVLYTNNIRLIMLLIIYIY